MTFSLRSWATPLVIGAFLIMAVSGVLMFFHLNSGRSKEIHEWAGMVMVAGGVAHLILNWRAFTSYLKRPLATAIMGIGVIVLGVAMIPGGGPGGPQAALRTVANGVSAAPIELLAEMAGKSTDAVMAALAAQGITGIGLGESLASATGDDLHQQIEALEAVFAMPRS